MISVMISEIISEILNDLGNYLLGSPFSAFVHMQMTLGLFIQAYYSDHVNQSGTLITLIHVPETKKLSLLVNLLAKTLKFV